MIRPVKDNVLLLLDEDKPGETASGIALVHLADKSKAYGHRRGTVLACGPGYEDNKGVFRATEVKPGDCVIVDVTAGDRYTYTKRQDFAKMFGVTRDNAEFRIVRNDEILAVIEGSSEVREGVAAAE